MIFRYRFFLVVTIILGLTGCQKKTQTPVHEQVQPVGAVPANMITGKVVETIDSGGYTYVRVHDGNQTVWAAANQFEVLVGEQVTFPPEMLMEDFESTSLERTFYKIYFVTAIRKLKPDQPPMPPPHGMSPAQKKGTPTPIKTRVTGINKLDGGVTVAELFRDKNNYREKTVRLRGRVVKFTPQIMGKNWIHIQDGTDFEGSFDLTVTSNSTVNVDDNVVVEGKVILDKDFGFGYKYDVLVVQADIKAE
ncbi:MAG: DNA-binding protein [Candidatus Marinimicrobia bacterium]|nr:DNA-binding protein [Candidatus Neomarinimicrobiota bacterium]